MFFHKSTLTNRLDNLYLQPRFVCSAAVITRLPVIKKGAVQMTWGPYWMFYQCRLCGKQYKYSVENIQMPTFGACPICKKEGALIGESRDKIAGAADYEEITP